MDLIPPTFGTRSPSYISPAGKRQVGRHTRRVLSRGTWAERHRPQRKQRRHSCGIARTTIPIHYNDYSVFRSPLDDFKTAVRRPGLEGKVHYLSHGEAFEFRYGPEPPYTVLTPGKDARGRGRNRGR